MTLHQLLSILRARFATLVVTLLACVSLAALASFLMPKRYTAAATVVIDIGSTEQASGAVPAAFMMPSYLPTQVQTIRSPRVADKAFKSLLADPASGPKLRAWLDETGLQDRSDRWKTDWLQRRVDVVPGRESNLIDIRFTAKDPTIAAAIANAFADAYVATDIELRVGPARHNASWLAEEERASRAKLEAAQRRVSEYQQKTGLVATGEQVDHEMARLSDLSGQLTTVQAATSDYEHKAKAARLAGNLPDMMGSELLARMKVQLSNAEARLDEVSEQLGANHPQRQSLEAEVASLRQRVRAETAQLAGSFATAGSVGRAREVALQAAIDAQKRRLLQMNAQRNELSVLVRERESAQRAYDNVLQRMTQTRLAANATLSNISVLAPAQEPLRPSAPRPLLYGVVAAVLGLVLGFLIAFMREARKLPVRSFEDLESTLELPVLAVLPREQRSRGGRPRRLSGSPPAGLLQSH